MLSLLRPPSAKASAAGPFVALHATGQPAWSARDSASLARTAYVANAVAHRAVRLIAEAAAAVPLILREGDALQSAHPLLDLLSRPNPSQDGRAMAETLISHLQIAGNAYIEAVADPVDATAPPRELHILRPDRMRVIPGANGYPEGYEYRVGNRAQRFTNPEDARPILHIKTFHPVDDHYGLSPLEAAATAVDVHNSAQRWNKALLDNAARPSGAIVYNGPDGATLSDGQYRRLKDELETHHQGATNAGRPILLEGGLDWKPMGFSPADMEFMKAKDSAAREIALAFGVPPMLLGLPGDNTYANYAEANRAFYRLTVLPLVGRLGSALSAWLGPRFDAQVSLHPDLDAVTALAPEREAHWRRISDADFLSDEQKRRLLNLSDD